MAKCPKCGEEIKELDNTQQIYYEYLFRIDKKGQPSYKHPPRICRGHYNVYACTKCDAALFGDEQEAIKFLKGKKK